MTRDEINAQIDELRQATDDTDDKLRNAIRTEVECEWGFALRALAETYPGQLKELAADYEVEVTDDVLRGVWLASQLLIDLDPEMALGED